MILPRPRAAALVAFLAGAGPVQALDPARALTQYARASWAEDRGLPQSSVETILQDRRGYLWLGTQDGLARFDGVRFGTFDAASSPELPSGEILALAEDREGRLWIGTQGGLAVREGETLRAIPGPQKARRDVGRLAVAADGTLWCGGQGGLLRVRGGRLEPDPRVTGNVSELLAAPDGALWIGVETRLVRRADGRDVEYSLPAGGRARSFAPARAGGLWIGTDKGVVRFAEGVFLPPAPGLRIDDDVWALHEDRQGNLWIATNAAGLLRLANGSLSRLTARDEFPEMVRALHEDRQGNLWVGSLSAGLIRLTDGEVLPYGEPEGLPHDSALGILAAPDGTLWLGTAGGGAHGLRQDGRRLTLSTRDGLPSDVVTTFHAARDGSLWIGTSAGLARSRAGRLTTFTARDGLPGDFVMGIQEDQAGTLWVATQRGLAALRNGRLTVYGQEHGLSGTGLRGVYEDRSGRLWVLTLTSVDILEGGRFVASPLAEAVGAVSFLEDSRGTIWVGSPDRLYRLDAGRVTSLGPSQGLAPGGVSRLAEDGSGDLWLSGAKGVFRYRRAELDELAAGRLARVTPRRFGRESGMRSAECTGGFQGAGDKDSDGRLWFPTSRGVVAIDPSRVREPPPAPPVLIESLSADGRTVDLARDVSLFPGPGQLRIEYTAFAYTAPEALSFRYRLDGVDGGWVEAGARRTAYYTNLRHGSYTFRVGAAGADGRWSGAETRLPFRVAPRFHETRAFLALAALVGLGLVAGAHRMRTRHLHAREERLEAVVRERTHDLEQALVQSREAMRQTETLRAATEALSDSLVKARQAAEQASRAKSTFVASMSHELRTPLNAILGFVQLLGRRPGRDAVDRGHLAVISRSGEHLLGLINDVLSIAKIESGQMSLSPGDFDVAALLLALRELLEPRAAAKGLELRVEVPAAAPRLVTGDEGKVRQILLNLMGNAVKFTDRGRVVLRCGWREGRASFEVEDTGPGLTPEEVEGLFAAFAQTETGRRRGDGTGLGLALSRSYARLMDGDISVSSTPGRGSLFRVDVALPRSASQEVVSPAPHRVVRGLAPGQSRSILVADDNEDARLLLGELLRSVGFEVRTAGDGQEALDAWRAAAPHLVFMDIDMPILDGIAAARAIRAEESAAGLSRTPVVALSASAFEHERAAVLVAGCDAFLAKPFREDDLFGLLGGLLGVTFVYDEQEGTAPPSPSEAAAVNRERLGRLPEAWRARFRDALGRADAEEALRLVSEVEGEDPALIRAIAARLKAYRMDELEELLEPRPEAP